MREGVALPQRIQDAPELELGLELFWNAFFELNSCRPQGLDGPGDIPWTAVEAYCTAHGLDDDDRADMFHHLTAMDRALREFRAREQNRG